MNKKFEISPQFIDYYIPPLLGIIKIIPAFAMSLRLKYITYY